MAYLFGTMDRDAIRRLIYGVRAKDRGEAIRHLVTRTAFVRCVAADARWRELSAQLRHESKLDDVVSGWSSMLDVEAKRLGLMHRSALHDESAYLRIPLYARAFFAECEQHRQIRTARTLTERTRQVDEFVCATLFSELPSIRAWLGLDLLNTFDAEVIREIWGDDAIQIDITAEALADLPKGLLPKKDGQHLERDATWYYQLEIQRPRATLQELAEIYVASLQAVGVTLASKDKMDGRNPRVNDSLVRAGAANAKRLLELPLSPDRWTHSKKFFKRQRAKRKR